MQDVIESIIKSRVDGVILFNDNFTEDEMEVLHEYQIPMVVVGARFEGKRMKTSVMFMSTLNVWLMILFVI